MTKYPFTYHHEIGHQGQSLVPHFPGGNSGVTIGPGYDLSLRTPLEVFEDLTKAGIDHQTAQVLSEAASLSGYEAQKWIYQHGGIFISEEQQEFLYNQVLVPEYEHRMMSQLQNFVEHHEDPQLKMIDFATLDSRQKEILFDYTYNAGLSRFPTLVEAVLKEDWVTVSLHSERFSGDMPLTYRNEMFYQYFLSAESDENFTSFRESDDTQEISVLLENFMNENTNSDSHLDSNEIDHLLDGSQWEV